MYPSYLSNFMYEKYEVSNLLTKRGFDRVHTCNNLMQLEYNGY